MKQQKKLPLVSVIMPVYNAGRFLVPAIESILKQTYPTIEFIIVDDGSTDGSWEIMKKYEENYPHVKAVRTEKKTNAAGNGATNFGLQFAKGTYIARMDADDISHPKRIEKQVAYMEAHPNIILLGSDATIINGKGVVIGYKKTPVDHDSIYQQYAIVHPIIHPSVMIRRSMLPDPDRLYAMRFDINDDYYTFFRLLTQGYFANIQEPLIRYRIHGHNLSLTNVRETILRTVTIRLEAIKNLNYSMPIWAIPIMVLQWIVGMVTPPMILDRIYGMLRGMEKPAITNPFRKIIKRLNKLFFISRTIHISKYPEIIK